MHVLPDILVTVVAYALAWLIVISGKVLSLNEGVLKPQARSMALIFIMPVHLVLYASLHLYVPKRIRGRRSELANICKANVIGFMSFTFALFGLRRFVNHLSYFSIKMILAFFAANTILLETERISVRIFLRSLWANDHNQEHMLLINYSRVAEGFIDRASVNPEQGYHVQGILDSHRPAGSTYKKVRVLGPANHLEDFPASNTLDKITITPSIKEHSNLGQIVAAYEKPGVHIRFIPDYNNIISTIPYMEDPQRLPVIHIRHAPLTGASNATMRRIADLADALSGLIIFPPLILATTLLIKVTSSGPALFSQERIGLHNRPFKMYKFRSMEVQDPGRGRSQWATPHDPRIVPMGRFIRKTGISEMSQFFNVLVGNMSLVGSRSERPLFVEKFKGEIPWYMVKHQVRSGLTDWTQANGYRGGTSITGRIEHSLYYIEDWSLDFGFKIMSLTIFEGFVDKNTY